MQKHHSYKEWCFCYAYILSGLAGTSILLLATMGVHEIIKKRKNKKEK